MIKPLLAIAATLIAFPVLAQAPTPTPMMTPTLALASAPTLALPMCSAKVTDGCQQTKAQQAREMSGAQADARDARNGGAWTPNAVAAKPAARRR